MIYGYAILKREKESYGLPFYRYEDWGDWFKISKVRLFSKKKERDNAMNIEISNNHYSIGEDILPFTTKSKQGKLHYETSDLQLCQEKNSNI